MRAEAEARLEGHEPPELATASPEVQRLMHELSVHQIELEMQNEQLRAAQLSLETARTRYFDLYDQAPVAYLMVDLSGRVLECNRGAVDLFRGTASRLQGRRLSEFVVPSDLLDFSRRRDLLISTGVAQSFELPMRRVDGAAFWGQLIMNAALSESSDSAVTRITITDISDRKRMEEEVARLASIVTSSDQAILSQSMDGEVTSWNGAAELLFGYPAREMIGAPLSRIFPADRASEEKDDRARVHRGEQLSYETIRIRRDGVQVAVFVSVSPILDPLGRITGVSQIIRSITQEVAARERVTLLLDHLREDEKALKLADQRKDEFIATLAHELRNPLAPIRNAAAVLRYGPRLDPKIEWCRDVIDRQVSHMATLLDDLLDVSRVTRHMINLHRERIELSQAIASALEVTRPLIDSRGHTLTVDLSPRSIEVMGDPTRLTQIFGNLLNNAAKYTDPGGRIHLSVEIADETVLVRVRDSGIGIDTDHLPHVFELFSQVDATGERGQSGLGIGLSLVKALVEMHGGSITAGSEGLGKGSEFVVSLPVIRTRDPAPHEVDSIPVKAVEHERGNSQRALIVDDNTDAAETLALMLAMQGWEVRTASDGEEAFQVAEQFRPGVAVLDVGLPGLNGQELCRLIRREPWGHGMLLIACTGWGQPEDQHRSKDAGFDHHLVKPVDMERLMTLLDPLARPASQVPPPGR